MSQSEKTRDEYLSYLRESWLGRAITENELRENPGLFIDLASGEVVPLDEIIELDEDEAEGLRELETTPRGSIARAIRRKLAAKGLEVNANLHIVGERDRVRAVVKSVERRSTPTTPDGPTLEDLEPLPRPVERPALLAQAAESVSRDHGRELDDVFATYSDEILSRAARGTPGSPVCLDLLSGVEACRGTRAYRELEQEELPGVIFTYPATTNFTPAELRGLMQRYIALYRERETTREPARKSRPGRRESEPVREIPQPSTRASRTLGGKEVPARVTPAAPPRVAGIASERPSTRVPVTSSITTNVQRLREALDRTRPALARVGLARVTVEEEAQTEPVAPIEPREPEVVAPVRVTPLATRARVPLRIPSRLPTKSAASGASRIARAAPQELELRDRAAEIDEEERLLRASIEEHSRSRAKKALAQVARDTERLAELARERLELTRRPPAEERTQESEGDADEGEEDEGDEEEEEGEA